jgi:hypothetical protein
MEVGGVGPGTGTDTSNLGCSVPQGMLQVSGSGFASCQMLTVQVLFIRYAKPGVAPSAS